MAKLKDDIITATDLTEYLATQDDFDLELYVYHAAKSVGLSATHGGTYEDPVTKKFRQYDIRASYEFSNSSVELCIECKSLQPTYPLLLSRMPRAEEESFHELIYSYEPSSFRRQLVPDLTPSKALRIKGEHSIYRTGDFVAKKLSQVGRNDKGQFVSSDGAVFDKWSQAMASATELVSAAHYAKVERKTPFFLTFIVPILVVSNDTLWVADYSDDGKLVSEPTQVQEATLFIGRDYAERMTATYTISHLQMVTKNRVLSFLQDLVEPSSRQIIFSHAGFKEALANHS